MENAKKILVVDDEAMSRKLVTTMLRNHGLQVIEAESAADALLALATSTPDLIILDGMLPDTTGFELGEAIRLDPSTKSVPILLVSGITNGLDGSDRFWKVSFTADDFLSKPFKLDKLMAKVTGLLRRGVAV